MSPGTKDVEPVPGTAQSSGDALLRSRGLTPLNVCSIFVLSWCSWRPSVRVAAILQVAWGGGVGRSELPRKAAGSGCAAILHESAGFSGAGGSRILCGEALMQPRGVYGAAIVALRESGGFAGGRHEAPLQAAARRKWVLTWYGKLRLDLVRWSSC